MKRPLRLAAFLANIGFGLIPSLAFFAWIERNSTLPYVALELHWPWLELGTDNLFWRGLWDFLLFLGFGAVHSWLAQASAHRRLERWFPAQLLRTVYLMVTGASLTLLMGLWQNTGMLVWALRLPQLTSYAVSLVVFWGLLGACGLVMSRFDALHFIGLRQLRQTHSELTRTSGSPELCEDGVFGVVRHPIYTFTLLAILITPVMSLDRLILFAAVSLYLSVGIPIEERKLISIFGERYVAYRKRVPAVLPFTGRSN